MLTEELQKVRAHRTANFERVVVFMIVILEITPQIKRQKDINKRLNDRMDLWLNETSHESLWEDTINEKVKRQEGGKQRNQTLNEKARNFDTMLKSGRTKEAMQRLKSSEISGVLQPEDIDTKTS